MSQRTSSLQSSSRRLSIDIDGGRSMTEAERFLRAAEREFDAEDSQRLAAREVLDRLISGED